MKITLHIKTTSHDTRPAAGPVIDAYTITACDWAEGEPNARDEAETVLALWNRGDLDVLNNFAAAAMGGHLKRTLHLSRGRIEQLLDHIPFPQWNWDPSTATMVMLTERHKITINARLTA